MTDFFPDTVLETQTQEPFFWHTAKPTTALEKFLRSKDVFSMLFII